MNKLYKRIDAAFQAVESEKPAKAEDWLIVSAVMFVQLVALYVIAVCIFALTAY